MYSSGLEQGLSQQQAALYLASIGLWVEKPSLNYLNQICRHTLAEIPFQNLTLLVRPPVPPEWDQVVSDMLTGLGGLCNTINLFLCALLYRLGFQSMLLPSAMLGEEGMHIAVGVLLNDRLYWLDCGNGFPYLQTLDTTAPGDCSFAGFQYSGDTRGQELAIIQSVLGTRRTLCNQRITLRAVHVSHFSAMLVRQYSDPSFGPFLSGIRLNRWQEDVGLILRNDLLANYPQSFRKVDSLGVSQWIGENFRHEQLPILYREALDRLVQEDVGKT